jgi:type II secretory pathway pseudopilin PulG
MVELGVVIVIIAVLVTIVLPPVSRMWEARKIATAENYLRAALTIALRRAASPDRGESGLLFVMDATGAQRIYQIERQAVRDPANFNATRGALISQNRFVILEDSEYIVPEPMRFAPLWAVRTQDSDNAPFAYSPEELANNNFENPGSTVGSWQEGQRHRNYFTLVFSADGRLLSGRDVLIVDADTDDNGRGDRTGLTVGEAAQYYAVYSTDEEDKLDIDPAGGLTLDGLISILQAGSGSATAVNFPSVNGLLLYDDAIFGQQPTPVAKRDMLLSTARPFYIAGPSGALVRGPIGETREVTP